MAQSFVKKLILPFVLLLSLHPLLSAQTYQLTAPDGRLQVAISAESGLHFTIKKSGKVIVPDVSISMELEKGEIPAKADKVTNHITSSVDTMIHPVVSIKNAAIPNHYNQLVLQYNGDYRLIFRAYDDAVAYRFVTDFKDSIIVTNEQCSIRFPVHTEGWVAFNERWQNDYQNLYTKQGIDSISGDQTIQLPLLVSLKGGKSLLITESALEDYPGLYFKGSNKNKLSAIFPPKAKTTKRVNRKIIPDETYPYIAKTKGSRPFPWRIFAVADTDKDLLNNEIVYKLADANRIIRTDWIIPGQVSWDWWNHWNITGVDFRAGINTKTYKYYIDFASRNHIPYIMIDDGWYEAGDVTKQSPKVNVNALVEYGKQKGVGIMLWVTWYDLDKQMDKAMTLFNQWGIKGLKVDFMDRDDQDLVNFYWRTAKTAAKNHLMLNFHGSHKPAGIQRTYPNVLNFEGVLGLEEDKGNATKATPGMAVTIPFTRMFAGPMDYTPGAMRNAQKKDFRAIRNYPMSQGTRCQQLAMFILYDAPLQMLADNPTIYEKNKECLHFITSIPTTWDQTIPLAGKVGEYVAMARKKGNEYFVGAMTNWNSRNLTIDLSFLPEGEWEMELFRDGVNADRNGIDYKREERTISNTGNIEIHMSPGGGWAARIYR